MSAENEHYRALVDHAPSLIWRTGTSGSHEYFNATWLAFTGRSMEQELGAGWLASVHPDDALACRALQEDHFARRAGFELEYRLRRCDGVYRRVVDRAVPYADAHGLFAGFVGNCVDIEDQSARAERFGVDDFFDMSLDLLCVVSYDGYFRRLNPSWTRTLGWSVAELMARPSQEFVHPDDQSMTLAGRARLHTGGRLGSLVNRYRCRDNSYRWLEWRSVAHDDRGLVYAAARDVTEGRQAAEHLREAKRAQGQLEQQLIFADRMASLGTLAAGVAHEVNNPLTYILANTNLMIRSLETTGAELPKEMLVDFLEQATDVREGAERIRKIVSGLKAFTRFDPEHHVVVDVRPILEQSIDMTHNEIRHRCRLVRDFGEIPPVDVDDAQLGQVFINLLINAAQALPDGENAKNEIRVSTGTDARGRAVIEIRDTGEGISPEVMGRIFDPFFTTKAVGTGTGLGLSICHSIVTRMGGELIAKSEHGRGASFSVVLPAAARELEEAEPVQRSPSQTETCGAILIVDDEPGVGRILAHILFQHELTVVTAAKQALELIDAGATYDVILSDLMMPEMSGMEFYETLATRFPEFAPRIVFMSGGAFTPAASAFLKQRTSNAVIDKPFDPEGLTALIEKMLA